MKLDVPDIDHRKPLYCDVLDGKPFTFTSGESLIQIQIYLLLILLKSGGQLWTLVDYWTQVGVATVHSASITDFY